MADTNDYYSVTAWLDECHRPMLIAHQRPDGDSLGAMISLALALQKRGAEPAPVLFDPLPELYEFMTAALPRWHSWEQDREWLVSDCDSVIIVDTCAVSQLETIASWLPQAPRTLVLDHHVTRDPIATRPNDLRLLDDTASAASLIVAELCQSLGVTIDLPLATALYVGIATDCGWFRFSNTDARTLRLVANLLEVGLKPNEIYRRIYQQDSLEKLRLIARMLDSLKLFADRKLAVMYLRQADFDITGADRNANSDLVNEAGRLGCTDVTLLFTEEADGSARVNFRSKATLDVSDVARRFGGGGHPRAAGARLRGKWDDVVPRVIDEVVEAIQK